MNPVTNEWFFRWDEDFTNGFHYHIKEITDVWSGKKKDAPHFKAGMLIPEPYASRYF